MTTELPQGPLVAWYGDDFTGSAATMEVLEFAGLSSVLFNDIPTPDQLARFPNARCIGIASTARSHGPDWMATNLPPAFEYIASLKPQISHYKVCSTFDSAPHVGSIGKAIDLAMPHLGGAWVPCLVAAPIMRRYQAFGHLFAGTPKGSFRLDRHPVMARHPVTPMDESDLARHLAKQTDRPIGLLDIEALESDPQTALADQIADGMEILSMDAMSPQHMITNGRLMWENRAERLFAVGSQGVEYALVAYWRDAGLLPPQDNVESAGAVSQIVAVSGSVSPTTAMQIDWAENNGFAPIALDAAAAAFEDKGAEDAAYSEALSALDKGLSPLIYTARGPDDLSIEKLTSAVALSQIGMDHANEQIGKTLGRLLDRLLRKSGIRRAVISGGDTSGHASRQLGLYAFTALAPTIPGAALLQAHSEDPTWAGLQLALKGGQMGSADYFGWIQRGGGL